MVRATTKADLTQAANDQFAKLSLLLDSMTEVEQSALFSFGLTSTMKEAHWQRDKCLRDVLIHLYEWHQLLLDWVTANQAGQAKPFLPLPYNWKTYGGMNVAFWEKHQATSYATAREELCSSHHHVMALIESLSDEELYGSGVLAWTGRSTLGAYCVSVTASHYDWAMKKIKAQLKAIRQPS